MTDILKIIVKFLRENHIDYMVFGGIANSFYGSSRQTYDIDIKINLKPNDDLGKFIKNIEKISRLIPKEPEKFINEINVLPVEINGIKIDLVFASLPYEIDSINNSKEVLIGDIKVKLISPEDFIIHKIISKREKDWLDIKNIAKNKKLTFDWNYIEVLVKQLSEWLSSDEILEKYYEIKNGK